MLRSTAQRLARSNRAFKASNPYVRSTFASTSRLPLPLTPRQTHAPTVSRWITTFPPRQSSTPQYTASSLSDGEYHKLSNGVLDSLTETFEVLLEEADIDALEQKARQQNQAAQRGSPASEWDIECAVRPSPSLLVTLQRSRLYLTRP